VKTQEAAFRFPVLGFTPDREIWGFPDINTLTSCGPRTLKDNMQAGMELVDADGRRWIVRSVRRVGRARPLLWWFVSALLTGAPQSRIEHELEQLETVSLSEVQARTCASLRAFPEDWGAGEVDEAFLEQRIAEVSNTQTIEAIHEILGLDSFMGY
jgi:hypothetical protein